MAHRKLNSWLQHRLLTTCNLEIHHSKEKKKHLPPTLITHDASVRLNSKNQCCGSWCVRALGEWGRGVKSNQRQRANSLLRNMSTALSLWSLGARSSNWVLRGCQLPWVLCCRPLIGCVIHTQLHAASTAGEKTFTECLFAVFKVAAYGSVGGGAAASLLWRQKILPRREKKWPKNAQWQHSSVSF